MKILNKIRSSAMGYKLGRRALEANWFVNNAIYSRLYEKKIKKTIEKFDKKWPSAVDIGTTNFCNAKCIMCPRNEIKEMGFMNFSLYKKIIDNCVDLGIKNVTLSFFGEPLMDKALIEKIKYAKSSGLNVGFFTNASLLDKNWITSLIAAGTDNIHISIDSYKKETYEKIRVGLNFDSVIKNINNLIEIRNEKKLKKPRINLVLVELKENKNEIKKFYKEWKKSVDSIDVITMNNRGGCVNEELDEYKLNYNKKRYPCALLWQRMVIDWNGDVVLCCDDAGHKVVLGNLNNQSIENIWSGRKLKEIRNWHIGGQFEKIPLCSACNRKSVWWLINT